MVPHLLSPLPFMVPIYCPPQWSPCTVPPNGPHVLTPPMVSMYFHPWSPCTVPHGPHVPQGPEARVHGHLQREVLHLLQPAAQGLPGGARQDTHLLHSLFMP